MPIYEYQCAACGDLHEALQKISDPPLTDCPACGRATLRKKVSAVAFRLKGSGWYETDFKSGNQKNLAGDSDGAKSASSEGGGDSGAKSGGESGSRNKDDNKSENSSQNKPRSSAKSADKTPDGPASAVGGAAQS